MSEKSEITIRQLEERLSATEKELKEANGAKSEFLMRINHEIRTPVNAITGMCYIAKNLTDIAKIKDCLSKIDLSAKQLLELIEDMLDMSKIEDNKFSLVAEEFELEKQFIEICKKISPGLTAKSQTLSVKFSTELKTVYRGDAAKLSQVIINLLSNATKFSPINSMIKLEASLLEKTPHRTRILFSVIDEGIGIDCETKKRLFVPFTQADGGISRRYGGTGLGLAISRKIVNLMGGDIAVESEVGKGSNFSFHVFLDNVSSASVKAVDAMSENLFDKRPQCLPEALESVKVDGINEFPDECCADPEVMTCEKGKTESPQILSASADFFKRRYSGDWREFLPYINVNAGLSRLMRNRKLYAKLLRNFLDLNGISIINIAAKERDLLVFADALHSIKATTGSLGIDALYECVKSMENEIKNNIDVFPRILELNDLMTKTAEYAGKVIEELERW